MKVLVFGYSGQVASAIRNLDTDHQITSLSRAECDLTNKDDIRKSIHAQPYDIILNAAAYTQVDQAEDEPELARAINAEAVGVMAEETVKLDIPLIHISTDYVFSSLGDAPLREADPTGPVSVYGQSKLAGEELIRQTNPKHLIFRTAWVHSETGTNFVKTMIRLMEEREELSIISDQQGTPTSAHLIAQTLMSALDQLSDSKWGTYHLTNTGSTNWYDFACEIQRQYTALNQTEWAGKNCKLSAISSAEYKTRATRPQNSKLDCQRIQSTFGVNLPKWQDGLQQTLSKLMK